MKKIDYEKIIRTGMYKAGIKNQVELSRLSGVSQAAISQLCSGYTNNPRVETLAALAETCGVKLSEFFGYAE